MRTPTGRVGLVPSQRIVITPAPCAGALDQSTLTSRRVSKVLASGEKTPSLRLSRIHGASADALQWTAAGDFTKTSTYRLCGSSRWNADKSGVEPPPS